MPKIYTTTEMSKIWSEKTKYLYAIRIEIALLRLYIEKHMFFNSDFIKDPNPFSHIDAIIARTKEIKKTGCKDTKAFVTAMKEYMPHSAYYIHKNLTNSDLKDCGLSLAIKDSCDLLITDITKLHTALKKKALKYKGFLLATVASTQLIPLGIKFASYVDIISRCKRRLLLSSNQCSFGKFSNSGYFTPKDDESFMASLGLDVEPFLNETIPRDRHAEIICTLAIVANCIVKIASDICVLPLPKKPIIDKSIWDLISIIRDAVNSALFNIEPYSMYDTRPGAVLKSEQVFFPQSFHIVHYIIMNVTKTIKEMTIDVDTIAKRVIDTAHLWSKKSLVDAIASYGIKRKIVSDIVQAEINKEAKLEGLAERLLQYSEIKDKCTKVQLQSDIIGCLDTKYILRGVDTLLERMS